MPTKAVLAFLAAASLSLLAAVHHFGDSGHAAGILSDCGGKLRHDLQLSSGWNRYVVLITGKVASPYRGSARITVEGNQTLAWKAWSPVPLIDLQGGYRVTLRDAVLEGLEPDKRFAVWMVLERRNNDTEARCSSQENRSCGVVFRDTANGKCLLKVPLLFTSGEIH